MTTRNFRVKNGISVGDIEISASANTITGLATAAPSADGDVANKKYVDDQINAISTTSITTDSDATNVAVSGTGASGLITVTANSNTEMTVNDSGMQLGGSGARVNSILDEDAMGSDSATALATQQSIKAYVDAQVTASDLDFQGDSGGALSIDLDSEVLDIAGGTGIDTTGSGNTLTVAIDSTVATLAGTQTFTNKTFDANGTGNSISNIEVADFAGSAIITVAETLASNDSDSMLVTAGAIIDYVDAQDANIASDTLTFTNKTIDANGTGNSITNIDSGNFLSGFFLDEDNMASNDATAVASQQSIKAYVDAEDANIASDTLTLTNKTFDANGTGNSLSNVDIADFTSGVFLDEDNMASNSATAIASQQSIKAYVDAEVSNVSTNSISQGNSSATISDTGSDGAFTVVADGNTELVINDTSATFSGNVIMSGNLTVNGTTTTVDTTNTTIADNIIELNSGISASSNDSGILIERGSTGDNAFIGWDESADKFTVGTTTATAGDKSGGISVTTGTLVANLEGDVTGDVTGTVSDISNHLLDEDNMASNDATKAPSQQSVKAYVDAEDANIASDTLTFTNKTIDANGTGNSITNIDSGNFLSGFFLDEDNMASDDATAVASQQSIKAYVDSQVTAQDLDFQGDSGGALSIDLDSETLDIAGGTGIDTSGSGNTLTVAIDSTVATLTGTQTLTNKTLTTPIISSITNSGTITLPTASDTLVGRATTDTLTNNTIDADSNTVSNIEVDNFKASAVVLESEGIASNDNDTSLPTSAAVKDYVDTQITAEDLDITTDSGTIAIDLDSETLTVAGTSNEIETSATGNIVTIGLPNSVTISGTSTATTFSGDLNGTINTATTATTQASGTSNTLVATTAFAVTEANNSAVAMAIALG